MEAALTQALHHPTRTACVVHAPADRATRPDSAATHALVLRALEDDKLEDIVEIDLRGKTAMADSMIVASGRSSRQVAAAADKLVERLKVATGVAPRTEGRDVGDWVLIDGGDVIVHIFRPEVREFYQLEKMWISNADQGARHAAG